MSKYGTNQTKKKKITLQNINETTREIISFGGSRLVTRGMTNIMLHPFNTIYQGLVSSVSAWSNGIRKSPRDQQL
jgi:hypothetical protein